MERPMTTATTTKRKPDTPPPAEPAAEAPPAPAVPAVRWGPAGLLDGCEYDGAANRPLMNVWLEGLPGEGGAQAGSLVAAAAAEFAQAECDRLFADRVRVSPELEAHRRQASRLASARRDGLALDAELAR